MHVRETRPEDIRTAAALLEAVVFLEKWSEIRFTCHPDIIDENMRKLTRSALELISKD